MAHIAIYSFFGLALVTGLYCLLLSIRVEFARVPRLIRIESNAVYHPAMADPSTPGRVAQEVKRTRRR